MNALSTAGLLPGGEVNRIASEELPWLAYPLIPDSKFKILKVDEITNTVILKFHMGPHVTTPRHGHHCVATAYTISGEWFYEDLEFRQGDIAYECTTDIHQPLTRDQPAELLTTFIGGRGNDCLLEEYADDGHSYMLRTRFFKALEGITQEQLTRLDLSALLS
jgi:hypothetical protein